VRGQMDCTQCTLQSTQGCHQAVDARLSGHAVGEQAIELSLALRASPLAWQR
jgi:hypothetical protein